MQVRSFTQALRNKLTFGMMALMACGAFAAACNGGTGSAYNTAGAKSVTTTPAATATTQASAATGVKVRDTALGAVLTNANGFTLYTFKKDVPGSGKSAAEAQAAVWPPLSLDAAPSNVAGATGIWAVFTRVDGKQQVTYNGSPLYTYANDQAPGDTTGDKVGGVWFASIPGEQPTGTSAAAPMPPTQSAAPVAQPTMETQPMAVPSPMPRPTAAPEATRAAPTSTPYTTPSGGYGY